MLPLQGVRVRSLVGELRSRMPHGEAKKQNKTKQNKPPLLIRKLREVLRKVQITESHPSCQSPGIYPVFFKSTSDDSAASSLHRPASENHESCQIPAFFRDRNRGMLTPHQDGEHDFFNEQRSEPITCLGPENMIHAVPFQKQHIIHFRAH